MVFEITKQEMQKIDTPDVVSSNNKEIPRN